MSNDIFAMNKALKFLEYIIQGGSADQFAELYEKSMSEAYFLSPFVPILIMIHPYDAFDQRVCNDLE